VEWFFLNGTGNGRVLSSDCQIKEEHNTVVGLEKYQIFCPEQEGEITVIADLSG